MRLKLAIFTSIITIIRSMNLTKNKLMLMTSIVMLLGIVLQIIEFALTKGGITSILAGGQIVVLVFYCVPFCILWAAAFWSKGSLVASTCLAIGLFFIVLNYLFNMDFLANLDGDINQVVIAMVTSTEILLPLIMVVCAIVSHAKNEAK